MNKSTTAGKFPSVKILRGQSRLIKDDLLIKSSTLFNYNRKYIKSAVIWVIVIGVLITGIVFAKNFYNEQKLELKKAQQQITEIQNKSAANEKAMQEQITSVKNTSARDAAAAASSAAVAAQNATNSNDNYAAIVSEWQNRVAKVTCYWNSDGLIGSGSATLINDASYGLSALTNKHVLISDSGYSPNDCIVGIYGLGARIISYNSNSNPFYYAANGTDDGLVQLSNPTSANDNGTLASSVGSHIKVCNPVDVKLGDKILILGYPYDGSKSTVTATQGVVSGYDGDYYVTDAKIDHGNSGGAAILLKNDCWLGIPSSVYAGLSESYGRILNGNLVLDY